MTRAKFTCQSVTKRTAWRGAPAEFLFDFEFSAVVGEGSDENKAFWAATPSGSVKLATVRSDLFEVGKDYYLDFSPA